MGLESNFKLIVWHKDVDVDLANNNVFIHSTVVDGNRKPSTLVFFVGLGYVSRTITAKIRIVCVEGL